MVATVPVVLGSVTVEQVEQIIHAKNENFTTINYIYIVDELQKLLGVISIKELLYLKPQDTLTAYTGRPLLKVRPHTDQERVAQLALKYKIKAVPVVSKEGIFLGVVDSDTILAVLNQEHTEDVLRFAGVQRKKGFGNGSDMILTGSSLTHVKSRVPWLVMGLLGGVGAAVVVGQFEATLHSQLILAAFIPAIVYMADAVGSQTQMLFVRALSIESNLKLGWYIGREMKVNFFIGMILAVLIFIFSFLWQQSLLISSILGLSIFLTVWSTVIIAIMLPWFVLRLGYDPAIASGPLATVVRDIISLCIYLVVASVLLSL